MSNRLPYEEQVARQWDDLPLPDENMAWKDMKRRLDEDDDKPLLPFWLHGCAGWGLLGLLLLAVGWWVVRPEKWFKQNRKKDSSDIVAQKAIAKQKDSIFAFTDTGTTRAGKNNSEYHGSSVIKKNSTQADSSKMVKSGDKKIAEIRKIENGNEALITAGNKREKKIVKIREGVKSKKITGTKPGTVSQVIGGQKIIAEENSPVKTILPAKADTGAAVTVAKNADKPDTVQVGKVDSSVKKTKTVTDETVKKSKKDSTNKKGIVFSAGIGLQQQLPVAGQQWTPYNSQGRKGTLADYIPSGYIRLTKPQKWFLHAEFRYGAPQYTKEFVYRQKIVNDTGANPRFSSTTSSNLKKTYYHQLPVTFNYFIRPNWSIGAGIQWNKFKSAVSEKQTILRNNVLQQDTVLSKFIQKEKGDSGTEFKKSYLQAVFETQYQWKRFSFGARYSFGLQPYIQFTLPGGMQQQERNNALQFFIRYELWKQKKK